MLMLILNCNNSVSRYTLTHPQWRIFKFWGSRQDFLSGPPHIHFNWPSFKQVRSVWKAVIHFQWNWQLKNYCRIMLGDDECQNVRLLTIVDCWYFLNCQFHRRFITAFHRDLTCLSLGQLKCMGGGPERKSCRGAQNLKLRHCSRTKLN